MISNGLDNTKQNTLKNLPTRLLTPKILNNNQSLDPNLGGGCRPDFLLQEDYADLN